MLAEKQRPAEAVVPQTQSVPSAKKQPRIRKLVKLKRPGAAPGGLNLAPALSAEQEALSPSPRGDVSGAGSPSMKENSTAPLVKAKAKAKSAGVGSKRKRLTKPSCLKPSDTLQPTRTLQSPAQPIKHRREHEGAVHSKLYRSKSNSIEEIRRSASSRAVLQVAELPVKSMAETERLGLRYNRTKDPKTTSQLLPGARAAIAAKQAQPPVQPTVKNPGKLTPNPGSEAIDQLRAATAATRAATLAIRQPAGRDSSLHRGGGGGGGRRVHDYRAVSPPMEGRRGGGGAGAGGGDCLHRVVSREQSAPALKQEAFADSSASQHSRLPAALPAAHTKRNDEAVVRVKIESASPRQQQQQHWHWQRQQRQRQDQDQEQQQRRRRRQEQEQQQAAAAVAKAAEEAAAMAAKAEEEVAAAARAVEDEAAAAAAKAVEEAAAAAAKAAEEQAAIVAAGADPIMTIEDWLLGLGLADPAMMQKFADQGFGSLEELLECDVDVDDLKEMEIPMRQRKIVLRDLQARRSRQGAVPVAQTWGAGPAGTAGPTAGATQPVRPAAEQPPPPVSTPPVSIPHEPRRHPSELQQQHQHQHQHQYQQQQPGVQMPETLVEQHTVTAAAPVHLDKEEGTVQCRNHYLGCNSILRNKASESSHASRICKFRPSVLRTSEGQQEEEEEELDDDGGGGGGGRGGSEASQQPTAGGGAHASKRPRLTLSPKPSAPAKLDTRSGGGGGGGSGGGAVAPSSVRPSVTSSARPLHERGWEELGELGRRTAADLGYTESTWSDEQVPPACCRSR